MTPVVLLLAQTLCMVLVQAPPRPPMPVSTQTSLPISPAVMATSFATTPPAGERQLTLLVLWRGTPGWFAEPGPRGSSGGGSATGIVSSTIKTGGLHLSVRLDEVKRIVTIDDQKPVELQDNNIVFVDEVDAATGPRVTRMLRVAPELPPGPPGPTGLIPAEQIRSSPQIVEFLRCDAKSPPGPAQEMLASLCERLLGIKR